LPSPTTTSAAKPKRLLHRLRHAIDVDELFDQLLAIVVATARTAAAVVAPAAIAATAAIVTAAAAATSTARSARTAAFRRRSTGVGSGRSCGRIGIARLGLGQNFVNHD
jgi:hypothetical protein